MGGVRGGGTPRAAVGSAWGAPTQQLSCEGRLKPPTELSPTEQTGSQRRRAVSQGSAGAARLAGGFLERMRWKL